MSDLMEQHQASDSAAGSPCPGCPVIERIAARTAEIGRGFVVRRALPTRVRRMVGAWCFLDHAGPIEHGPGEGLKVGPHPHIGLQTFTWMIEGEALHRDSLGFEQIIRPGQVNLMTAGRGITHSEESPGGAAGRLQAAQLWIALPDSERHREPSFHHYPELPTIEHDGFSVTVLTGEALGEKAPAEVFSPLVAVDLSADAATETRLPLNPDFEHAAMCLVGAADVAGERIEPGTLLYLGQGRDEIEIGCRQPVRLLLVGGQPFDEEILMWWNFVAREPGEILAATEGWNNGTGFDPVPGTSLDPLKAPDPKGLGRGAS